MVTSSAQNDSGLFEPNLRDERYLPFGGAGAISEWRLQLPQEFRQFDYDTISDVILHIRYTAREGGEALKERAASELQQATAQIAVSEDEAGLVRLFSARHEFSGEWHRFLHPASAAGDQSLTLALTQDRFPYLFQGKNIAFRKIELFIKVNSEFASTHNDTQLKLSLDAGATASGNLLALENWNGLLRAETVLVGAPGDWTLSAWLDQGGAHARLDPNALVDLVLVCHYTAT
jgi:hypothetical protein